ncbi:hypothetical protein Pelo_19476 [Pelomyxa schiedti]|nr:hypothetical protein Pelo_19476 [Pelomyxa schiedti]
MAAATTTTNTPGVDVGDCVDAAVCGVCMDMFRDPVTLDCGHTVCRPCALATLVPAARLAQLHALVVTNAATPAAAATTAAATTTTNTAAAAKTGAGGGAGATTVGTMPGQTNAPQSGVTSSSSRCQWGCCSPGATAHK